MFLLSKKGATLVLIGFLFGLLAPSDADSIRCHGCEDQEDAKCEKLKEMDCPNVNRCIFGAIEGNDDKEAIERGCGQASNPLKEPSCYLDGGKPQCTCFTDLCNDKDPNVEYKKGMEAEGSKPGAGGAAGKSTKISASCGLVLRAMAVAVAFHSHHHLPNI